MDRPLSVPDVLFPQLRRHRRQIEFRCRKLEIRFAFLAATTTTLCCPCLLPNIILVLPLSTVPLERLATMSGSPRPQDWDSVTQTALSNQSRLLRRHDAEDRRTQNTVDVSANTTTHDARIPLRLATENAANVGKIGTCSVTPSAPSSSSFRSDEIRRRSLVRPLARRQRPSDRAGGGGGGGTWEAEAAARAEAIDIAVDR